jgi:hypothetical protein
MENDIINVLAKFNQYYTQINNDVDLKLVHKLLLHNHICEDSNLNTIVLFYYGVYYKKINKDYVRMREEDPNWNPKLCSEIAEEFKDDEMLRRLFIN